MTVGRRLPGGGRGGKDEQDESVDDHVCEREVCVKREREKKRGTLCNAKFCKLVETESSLMRGETSLGCRCWWGGKGVALWCDRHKYPSVSLGGGNAVRTMM
jgi:hypothetical protein